MRWCWTVVAILALVAACESGGDDELSVDAGATVDGGTVDGAGPTIDAQPVSDAQPASDGAISVDASLPAPDAAVLPPPEPGELLAPPYLMWVTQGEVSVRWETASAVTGRVDYGPTPALGTSELEDAPTAQHEFRLAGLTPGSTVYYRVSWETAELPVAHFVTAPADGDTSPFRFVVWGDNQDGADTFSELITHMVATDPMFALSVGDCVQNGTRNEYRSQCLGPLEPFADHVPFLIAGGNHERLSDPDGVLFDEYVSQPADEHCFGWRWGELFVVFIDTELSIDPGSAQHACITDALGSAEATASTFQAAVFHKPPRIEWWFGGALAFPDSMEAPQVRETLEPLLESLGVDIVFNGHNHLYAQTPQTPGGITWVTTGGAGGMIDTDFALWRVGTWPQIETTIHEHHFLSVGVDSGVMTVEAIDLDGAVLDTFTVTP